MRHFRPFSILDKYRPEVAGEVIFGAVIEYVRSVRRPVYNLVTLGQTVLRVLSLPGSSVQPLFGLSEFVGYSGRIISASVVVVCRQNFTEYRKEYTKKPTQPCLAAVLKAGGHCSGPTGQDCFDYVETDAFGHDWYQRQMEPRHLRIRSDCGRNTAERLRTADS